MLVWTLTDLNDTAPAWQLPVNPNQMDPPELASVTATPMPETSNGRRFQDTHQVEPHSRLALVQQPTVPVQWTFDGVIYTLDDIFRMHWWVLHTTRIKLSDHLARHWMIELVDFEQVRAQTQRWRERHTYTMHCLMLGRMS